MRALEFDFRRRDRGARRAGVLLLLAAFAGAAALGARYQQLSDELAIEQAMLQDTAVAARRQASSAVPGTEAQALTPEYRHAGEVLLQLARPWGELFQNAESSATPDVALLSIESDLDKRRVNISGEAKHLEAVLEYLRVLAARPVLADVYLQSHELQKQDPQRPVRFVLSAQWAQRR